MEVLKNANGDYEISPIDYFIGSVPVEKWITEKPSENDIKNGPDNYAIDQIIERAALYGAARAAYYKASGLSNDNRLRDEPMVCTNYDFSRDTSPIISYWFLFKEENNGSTYRVFHKDE